MLDLSFSLSAAGILLVFYLYLLVKPQCVKKPMFFWIGSLGLVLAIIGSFFLPWIGSAWAKILVSLFSTIGSLVALIGVMLACCGEKLHGVCYKPEEPTSE